MYYNKGEIMLNREELIKIVKIFHNDGIDEETGKKIEEDTVYELWELFDEAAGFDSASNIIFSPIDFGLDKESTPEEIVDFILRNHS